MKTNRMVWIIIVAVGIFIVLNIGQKQELLPAGEYNYWPDSTTCTFTTNVNPIDSIIDDYGESGAWLMIDRDGDMIKEAYGKVGTKISVDRLNDCGRPGSSALLLVDSFNSYGHDIYYYYTSGKHRIYVCSEDGTIGIYYQTDDPDAANAVDCEQIVDYGDFISFKNNYINGAHTFPLFITNANTWIM